MQSRVPGQDPLDAESNQSAAPAPAGQPTAVMEVRVISPKQVREGHLLYPVVDASLQTLWVMTERKAVDAACRRFVARRWEHPGPGELWA